MLFALTSKASGDGISVALERLANQRNDLAVLDVSAVASAAELGWAADGCSTLNLPAPVRAALGAQRACVNRAFLCEENLATRPDARLMLQTELEDCLRSAINAAPAATARAGLYGLCGDHLPLYLQWRRVEALSLDVTTPRYDYAFGSLRPDVSTFGAPIYKSAFDLRRWKSNEAPALHWHSFVVDRPPGQPVVAVVAGQRVMIQAVLPPRLHARVETASQSIRSAFGSEFGELLFFHDGDTLCFAAFSHVVRQAIAPDELDAAVEAVLQQHLH